MELNIFCINNKKKKKTTTQTATASGRRSRLRLKTVVTGRRGLAGNLAVNWALGESGSYCCCSSSNWSSIAARLLFQFTGDRLSLDLHLAINRSIYRTAAQANQPVDCNFQIAVAFANGQLLATDNVKHLALAISISIGCQIRTVRAWKSRKWTPIPVSLTLSNLHALHFSSSLLCLCFYFALTFLFIYLIYFRISNQIQMPRFV